MPGLIRTHLPNLLNIGDALGMPRLPDLARQPGVVSVYRVSIQVAIGRVHDSAATLRRTTTDGWRLETGYRGMFENRTIHYPFPAQRGEIFAAALAGLGFDRFDDAPDVPDYLTTDIWLVERAAGTFYHAVLLAPEHASGVYVQLVNAIKNGLPEAVRRLE